MYLLFVVISMHTDHNRQDLRLWDSICHSYYNIVFNFIQNSTQFMEQYKSCILLFRNKFILLISFKFASYKEVARITEYPLKHYIELQANQVVSK